MRLIDADAPRKTFVDWLNWYKGSEAVRSIVREAVDILDEAPTVDAEPVRHGGWIERPTGAYGAWQTWCSACGKHSGIGGIKSNRHKPYCPNCGARMDAKDINVPTKEG